MAHAVAGSGIPGITEGQGSTHKEYWRPLDRTAARVIEPLTTVSLCPRCETEYTLEGRYCHVCGQEREPRTSHDQPLTFTQYFDMEVIRQRLGLSVSSLVFFLIGLTCLVGALLTGFVYRASTVLDWQAVQLWRIEWLLAASASLLAGILVKKRDS